jgi:hypothetical protein
VCMHHYISLHHGPSNITLTHHTASTRLPSPRPQPTHQQRRRRRPRLLPPAGPRGRRLLHPRHTWLQISRKARKRHRPDSRRPR